MQGIYRIRHLENGRTYLGYSIDVDRRFGLHIGSLRRGTHHNARMQEDWREGIYVMELVEEVAEVAQLAFREQYAVQREQPYYNQRWPHAGERRGGRRNTPGTITLPPEVWDCLQALGGGIVSAGIRRLVEEHQFGAAATPPIDALSLV